MNKIESNFRDGGFDHVIIDREGDVILAGVISELTGKVRGYIVFHVKRFADRYIMGNFSPAHESVPSPDSWGDEGWTFSGGPAEPQLERAYEFFVKRVAIRPTSPLIEDGPTGKARGRERNVFELDLSSLTGEFEFSNIKSLYPETDEPMLRNRLRSELEAGFVRVLREIPGGRGKPRKVYEVVK